MICLGLLYDILYTSTVLDAAIPLSAYGTIFPNGIMKVQYTVKKVHEFPVSSRDVTNQTSPGQE